MTAIRSRANVWGTPVPTIGEILETESMLPFVRHLLEETHRLLRLPRPALDALLANLSLPAITSQSDLELELTFKKAVTAAAGQEALLETVRHRSQIAFEEIQRYLKGDSLLDVGCGNGIIAKLASPAFARVQLLDVVDYVDPEVDLPFELFSQNEALPVRGQFDCSLLLTVLHHAERPLELLRETWRRTSERLIIIESVYDAPDILQSVGYPAHAAGRETQLAFAVFVDWLYNRVLMTGVPVPYNFRSPSEWEELFAAEGMTLAIAENLGRDIPIAPELHYLFVLDR